MDSGGENATPDDSMQIMPFSDSHLYADVLALEVAIRAIPVAGPLALEDRVLLRVNVLGPAHISKKRMENGIIVEQKKTRPGQKREER